MIFSSFSRLSGRSGRSFLSISAYRSRILRVPPFKPISRYSATPMIGNTSIRMIHGIFMEEVWSDAYSARTRIPAKTLVSRLTISAYSFSLVITIMIKAASNKIQSTEKHNRMTPFFVFALPSSVSCFIKPPLSALNENFLLCVSLTEYSCCVIKSTFIVYTANSGALT